MWRNRAMGRRAHPTETTFPRFSRTLEMVLAPSIDFSKGVPGGENGVLSQPEGRRKADRAGPTGPREVRTSCDGLLDEHGDVGEVLEQLELEILPRLGPSSVQGRRANDDGAGKKETQGEVQLGRLSSGHTT